MNTENGGESIKKTINNNNLKNKTNEKIIYM